MTTVKQLLQTKGTNVWTIAPDATVQDALKVMADKNVGALLVLEAGELTGIFSERDYARIVARKEEACRDTPVREIMTKKVIWIHPDQTIEECMALMTDKRVRHLPVLVDGRLAGVVSIGDVVKEIISHQEFIIEQLENYIVGSG